MRVSILLGWGDCPNPRYGRTGVNVRSHAETRTRSLDSLTLDTGFLLLVANIIGKHKVVEASRKVIMC